MSMMITLLSYTPSSPRDRLTGRTFFAAKYGREASALLEIVNIARRIERGGFKESPKCEILLENSSLDTSSYRMPYCWRKHIFTLDDSTAVILFLEMQAALCGPHECRCGELVQLTTEYDLVDDASGYQWSFGVCDCCKCPLLAFGDSADNVFVQSKIDEHRYLLGRDRFNALHCAYQVGMKGARFILRSPPATR